jgi:hypothetical protein
MAATTTEEDTKPPPDPVIAWLAEKAKQFSDEADSLRATTDRAAKALSALATAGLTAVGIAKVGDLYPKPDGGYWPTVLFLWLGFVLMLIALFAFVVRFWRANRPLAVSTSLVEMWPGTDESGNRKTPDTGWRQRWKVLVGGDLPIIDEEECKEIARIYKDAIKHAPFAAGEKDTLKDYEGRADELESDALYTPDSPISLRRMRQVARMRAEIEKAEQRAKLVVIRRRMNHVFNRPAAAILAIIFVVGLVMFAAAADRFDSEHPSTKDTGSATTPEA